MSDQKRFALITGASSGIGAEFARQLAARGWSLVLVARSQDRLALLREQLLAAHSEIEVRCIGLDLSTPLAPAELFQETQSAGLEITLLINNAGFGAFGEFAKTDRQRLRQMVELNVAALVELSHFYLQEMYRQSPSQRRDGGIINIGSVAGFMPLPYSSVYAATKAFVLSFSHALADEAHQHGVQVMVVNPGTTATNFFEVAGKSPFSHPARMQTPAQVVRESLSAFDRGRRLVTTGASNRVLLLLAGLIPRRWIASVVGRIMRRSKPTQG